ncbi:MAG: site-specific DNA-methyltransferase, partial [Fibrobacter sp.]|nr:site-specific DNA-methyltransferase [Fibrobacter sp.]
TEYKRLELSWLGKEIRPRIEPRILLEDKELSYCARSRKKGDLFDNRLIFGDNLLALKALEHEFMGKVKCIYIDPPFNTGSAFEHYDDGIEHSIWLGLMRDRLVILRNLLSKDGSIWISIDDNECHYLKVMMDELFGRDNFVASVIWEKRTTRENRRVFSFRHDYILVYAKDKKRFEKTRNLLPLNSEVLSRYKNPDNDPRGPWQSVSANAMAGHATPSQFYTIVSPAGIEFNPPPGRCWLVTKKRHEVLVQDNRIWFGKDGKGVPRIKKFLEESDDKGLTPETMWSAEDVGTNDSAKKHLIKMFEDTDIFDTPKPEELVQRIIQIATNPGDLVLDSFLGSGTTAAVAHKMGRRWIGIELGEHCHTHCIPRLKKVIDGEDPGGITKAVNWEGGGGFRYFRLAPTLLKKDKYGFYVINKEYNPEMLAEAMCKLHGFTYAPNPDIYWMHGQSTETDYIYVTTQFFTQPMLDYLSDEVGKGRTLLVLCLGFRANARRYKNLTIKKIPLSVLSKYEWEHDDYSLKIENLPVSRKKKTSKSMPLFDGLEDEEGECE